MARCVLYPHLYLPLPLTVESRRSPHLMYFSLASLPFSLELSLLYDSPVHCEFPANCSPLYILFTLFHLSSGLLPSTEACNPFPNVSATFSSLSPFPATVSLFPPPLSLSSSPSSTYRVMHASTLHLCIIIYIYLLLLSNLYLVHQLNDDLFCIKFIF